MHLILAGLILTGIVAAIMPGTAHAGQKAYNIEGYWISPKKDVVIHIERCATGICGKIHWLHPDVIPIDGANPEADKRHRGLCNISVLWGFRQSGNNPERWQSGWIYKADDGEVFKANLSLTDHDTMRLRGYIGLPVLGKSYIFSRVDEHAYPACEEELQG